MAPKYVIRLSDGRFFESIARGYTRIRECDAMRFGSHEIVEDFLLALQRDWPNRFGLNHPRDQLRVIQVSHSTEDFAD